MIARKFFIVVALLRIGMMFPLVSSLPLTEGGEQKPFKNPFTPNGDDNQNFFQNPSPSNEGDKQNFFKNPFPSNEGDKQNFFKNLFPSNGGDKENYKNPSPTGADPNEEFPPNPMRGFNYWYTRYNPRATLTCDKFPRVCRQKGSPGPDCCKKMCVNVMTDNLNCGECGRRCRFGQTCCGGTCVNVLYDQKNCGGCKKRCKKGSFCNFGMCSYA
jgi:Stigma-specific protein, Stig1